MDNGGFVSGAVTDNGEFVVDRNSQQEQTTDKSLLDFVERQVFHADVIHVLSEDYCRVAIINYDLWVISRMTSRIIVLKPDGNHVRNVKIHDTSSLCAPCASGLLATRYRVTMVTQTLRGDIVASCCGVLQNNILGFNTSSNKDVGLVMINDKGQIQEIICQGQFNDVTHDSHCVYGLTGGRQHGTPYKVKIFYANDIGSWIAMNDVTLEAGYEYDRLMVRNSLIYLSIHDYDCSEIHQYNQESVLIGAYGQNGSSNNAGSLRYAYLCDVDIAGCLLIADWFNDRLQVMDSDKRWYIVNVINLVRPYDAVLHCATGITWVVAKDKRTDTPAVFAVYCGPTT